MALRIIASLLMSLWAGFAFSSEPMKFAVDPAPLLIQTTRGDVVFNVEIANTDVERAAGLMFRKDFPANRAIMFDFKITRPVSMWMKNTPLPLDMLFADVNGLIVGVSENTIPQSLDVISSPKPVLYVVEINAGQAAVNSIRAGDVLVHPLIKP